MNYSLNESTYNRLNETLSLDNSREAINAVLDHMEAPNDLNTDREFDRMVLVKAVDEQINNIDMYHMWDLVDEHKENLAQMSDIDGLMSEGLVSIDRQVMVQEACESMYTVVGDDQYINSEILQSVGSEIESDWESLNEEEQMAFYEANINDANDDLWNLASDHYSDPNLALYAALRLEDHCVDEDELIEDVKGLFGRAEEIPEHLLEWDMKAVQDSLEELHDDYNYPVQISDDIGSARLYVRGGDVERLDISYIQDAKEAVTSALESQKLGYNPEERFDFDLEAIGKHHAAENGYNLVNEEQQLYVHEDDKRGAEAYVWGVQELGQAAVDNADTLGDLPKGTYGVKAQEEEVFELPESARPGSSSNYSYESALTGAKEKAMAQKDQDRDR